MSRKTRIKDFLKDSLNESQILELPRSFEIVGDIAICEIPENLKKYEKDIGEAILKVNSALKVVLKKSGIHKGEFRTQNLIHIAGENRKETIYKENNILLKINPETVYFSARLSTEREKLMSNLKENKRILIMFSGAGPYSYVAFRKQPNVSRITSIEINEEGHKYALSSLELNKNIIKKSNSYINLIKFLKKYKLPIFEKKLVELLNSLKLNFINADVKEEVKKLNLELYNKKISQFHNELFKQNPENLFKFLKETKIKEIFLDLNNKYLNKETILNFFILFSNKFNFICKINSENYIFKNKITKTYLLNYLEDNFEIKTIKKYDEIFMPLPKDASLFLDSAFEIADKNCKIYMYDFLHEKEFPQKSENEILYTAKKLNREIEIIKTRKVGQYSPRKFRVCCEFIIK